MKEAVDGLMERANTLGKNSKADFHRQMKTLTNELVEMRYDPEHERAD